MNFFEQELRKIVSPRCPDASYVGRACFVRLDEMTRAKFEFTTCGHADHYEAIRATILNRGEGQVDCSLLRFSDLLGRKQVGNPNFREGIIPCVWVDGGKAEWYVYKPTAADYAALGDAVSEYLSVFQEQTQEAAHTFQQTL